MQWLKTWLMKWLGIDEVRTENAELILRLDVLNSRIEDQSVIRLRSFEDLSGMVENLREHYASVKEMGDACMARLDRETMKLAEAIVEARDASQNLRTELIEIVKLGERDEQRISELEVLVKDGTLDTALAALEDRVAKLESSPTSTAPQVRRGGSAWGPHQVAAAAGAARANGSDIPLPTPGVS